MKTMITITRSKILQIRKLGKINDFCKNYGNNIYEKFNNVDKINLFIPKMLEFVCDKYYCTQKDLLSRKRNANFSEARSVVMYFANKHLCLSTIDSGKIVNRDHSNCIHHLKKIDCYYDNIKKGKSNFNDARVEKMLECISALECMWNRYGIY